MLFYVLACFTEQMDMQDVGQAARTNRAAWWSDIRALDQMGVRHAAAAQ